VSTDKASKAEQIAKDLLKTGAKELVLKAQVHAGGRGKGHFDNGFKGGVHVLNDAKKVGEYAKQMLGHSLITKQTDDKGQMVKKVLVLESLDFDKEFYFAILMDRTHLGPVLVVSKEGGMDIEKVAEEKPDAIMYEPVDIMKGIEDSQAKKVAEFLGFTSKEDNADAAQQIKNLYDLFIGEDATQVEINPLVRATDGQIYCVDAKINFDDNAEYRHKDVFSQRDWSMEDPREVEAAKYQLNYIGLKGNIGCMVNGAGLAMATMDIIKLHGGAPANFLDVGGGANEKQVEAAFKILTSDKQVKAILVNIFGGIMRCDVIAQGIVNAAKNLELSTPLVVRLEGTNVQRGKQILEDSGIKVETAEDLDDAAERAVKAVEKGM